MGMRKFTEKEKKIIKKIVNEDRGKVRSFSAQTVYAEVFRDLNNSIGIDLNEGVFYYYSNNNDLNNLTSAEQELIDTTLLLQYLDRLNLLVFTEDCEECIGINNARSGTSQKKIIPQEIQLLIKRYLNCKIYISSLLIDIVENDFKSLEELALDEAKKQTFKTKKQIRNSWIAIGVSILAVILSHCCSDKIQIEEEQLLRMKIYSDSIVERTSEQLFELKQSADIIGDKIQEQTNTIQVTLDTCFKKSTKK